MYSINNLKYQDSNDLNNRDIKKLVNIIFKLYKDQLLSEKAFKHILEILLTSYIDDTFKEKYYYRFQEYDFKLLNTFNKLLESYEK